MNKNFLKIIDIEFWSRGLSSVNRMWYHYTISTHTIKYQYFYLWHLNDKFHNKQISLRK